MCTAYIFPPAEMDGKLFKHITAEATGESFARVSHSTEKDRRSSKTRHTI